MGRSDDSERVKLRSRGSKLPVALTSFVGREREIADATSLLASARLVTLTGTAGCGKTRLALHVAEVVRESFPDGVHWVELAGLTEPELVPQTIARALGVAEQAGRAAADSVLDALASRRLLIALDNCEHVLSACAGLVERLLAGTDVTVLATSRQPLGVAGETRYPLSPLEIPPAQLQQDDIDQFDAVRLFVERASTILPSFMLTPENAIEVVTICRALDGLPLAIELASARVNVLSVQEIAARLRDRSEMLSIESPATLGQHPTMRAAIDWSYDLLSEPERVLFRRLSVFSGGCWLRAVEAVCAGDGIDPGQSLDLLSSLVDQSLVTAETLHRGEARYSLLETVRQYARERLEAAGESDALRDRHLEYFVGLVEEIAPKLSSAYQHLWLNWLEEVYDNVRASLAWSLESGRIEAGLRMSVGLYEFWTIRNYTEEGLAWFRRLLARPSEEVSPLVRAAALAYASLLAGFRGDRTAQMEYGLAASALAKAADEIDDRTLFWALSGQAYHARMEGDTQAEFDIVSRIIPLSRSLDDDYLLGLVLSLYSPTMMALGKFDAARDMLDEGLSLLRESGDTYRIAMALNYRGDLARCEQHYVEARATYEQSASLLREIDAARDLASVLHNLGLTCLRLGDIERAQALIDESMAIQQAQRNAPGIAECLIGFAALALAYGLSGAAARLLAAAVTHGGDPARSVWAATRMEYEHALALARAGLSDAEYRAERATGESLSLDAAIDYGRTMLRGAALARSRRTSLHDLTARERQIAMLIAQAKTNDEIADQLFVSKRTVEKHVANIRSKLGFSQRAQIVRWAIEGGVVTTDESESTSTDYPSN
jgi:predicted ATPase/DNA-binding NarL/FixJ family response regulator